jgi:hypothetical protein
MANTIQNGKGSKKRPVSDLKTFNDNWDLIFKKKKKKSVANPKEKEDNN